MQKEKIGIVIPAYNESKRLYSVIEELKKEGYSNIVVIDDGSSDNTYEIAKNSKVTALKHILNRGQGAALKTGIDYLIEEGNEKTEIILTYDADGQFLVKEIPLVVSPVEKGEADICFGSRFLGKAVNIPFLKKAVLKIGILVVFFLYGIKISDSQSGFRAMTKEAAEKINITADRMEHAGEIFSEVIRNKLKYKEVPITIIYDKYSLGKGQEWDRSISLGLKMLFRRFMR